MSSLESHLKETLLLTNSLVIKLFDTAISINNSLINKGYNVTKNKRTWKYFLNLAGIKHESNNEVKINILENNKESILSKDLLDQFPYTRIELKKQSDFYKELINKYPDEEMFIKGCIFPVDLDTAIEAKDGTILNYDTSLIERNELSLIPELEIHIKDFINRWNIKEYSLVDELYCASFQAVLYASIPSKIINIRLDKTNTNEVHSFHLENYFNSNLKLWNNLSILKEETKLWLYRNLPFLIKQIGRNSTLDKIVNKVFGENSIGIGEYTIVKLDPALNSKINNLDEPSYIDREPLINIRPMNKAYEVDTDSEIIIEQVLLDELNTIVSFTDRSLTDNYIIEEDKKDILKVNNAQYNQQKTKILDIKINRTFKNYGVDVFKIIMDYWAYVINNERDNYLTDYRDANTNNINTGFVDYSKKINKLTDFIDPNSNKSYSITPYQGFLFMIKILLKIVGYEDAKIIGYNYDIVLNKDPNNLIKIYNKMYKDGYTDILLNKFLEHYPKVDTYIFNNESFNRYINSILTYYTYIWNIDANSESCIISSNIKQLYYLNMQRGQTKLIDKDDPITGLTINELLAKNKLEYELSNTFDLMLSLNGLVKTFTGYNISEYYTKDEILVNAKELLSKLTAYTTQILTTSDDIRSLQLYYNNIAPFQTKHPIIGDITGKLCPYEHNYFKIKTYGYNVMDNPVFIIENVDWKQSAYERVPAISGIGALDNTPEKPFDKNEPPRTILDVKDNFVFDITKSSTIESIDINPPIIE